MGSRSEEVNRREHDDIVILKVPTGEKQGRAQTSAAFPTLHPPASASSCQMSSLQNEGPWEKQAMEVSPRHRESQGQE